MVGINKDEIERPENIRMANDPRRRPAVRHHAGGRQAQRLREEQGSFSSRIAFCGRDIPLEFIRTPMIIRVGEGVGVLCGLDGPPVAVRYGNQAACAFHPELTGDDTVHRYFRTCFLVQGLCARND